MARRPWKILAGDALEVLRGLPSDFVHCSVTSPPYLWLRDYGVAGQIGNEYFVGEYIANLITVYREVRRILHPLGAVFVNMGDKHASCNGPNSGPGASAMKRLKRHHAKSHHGRSTLRKLRDNGLKPKDLVGVPWRLALALQEDGWYLRSEIIWWKPNGTPEPDRGRIGVDHETIFLLTKSKRSWWDADAVRETTGREASWAEWRDSKGSNAGADADRFGKGYRKSSRCLTHPLGKMLRSVWRIPAWGHPDSRSEEFGHFATFPPELPRRCILAGCPEGGIVLDPFSGLATTGVVANALGRQYIGIELNPKWAKRSKHWLRVGLQGLERKEGTP